MLLLEMSSGKTYEYDRRDFNPSEIPVDATKVYALHVSIPIISSGNIFSHVFQSTIWDSITLEQQ